MQNPNVVVSGESVVRPIKIDDFLREAVPALLRDDFSTFISQYLSQQGISEDQLKSALSAEYGRLVALAGLARTGGTDVNGQPYGPSAGSVEDVYSSPRSIKDLASEIPALRAQVNLIRRQSR